MVKFKLAFLASAAATLLTVSAAFADEADEGKKLYNSRTCVACHANAGTANRVGPSLFGIVGRKAGAVEGDEYSAANKDLGIAWTEDALAAYLRDPGRARRCRPDSGDGGSAHGRQSRPDA